MRRVNALRGAAANLEEAGAQLAQDAAEDISLFLSGDAGRVIPVFGGGAEPQRAGQHTLSNQLLHGLDFLSSGLGPLRGCFTHNVASYSGVADQGAHVDATPLAQGVKVLRDGSPSEVHPVLQRT